MGMPPNSNAEGNQIGIIVRYLVNTVDIPFNTSRDAINRKAWSTIITSSLMFIIGLIRPSNIQEDAIVRKAMGNNGNR